jgi:hypothetical protein
MLFPYSEGNTEECSKRVKMEIISFRNSDTVTKLVTNPKFITDKKKLHYINITVLKFLSSCCNGFMFKENCLDCEGWKYAALRSANRGCISQEQCMQLLRNALQDFLPKYQH